MKKTFIFGLIAAALGFTACSSEDDLNVNDNNQKKGMVLRATVEQPAESRATFTDGENGAWVFDFAKDDEISVTNMDMSADYYTFTNDGTEFKSEDAKAAESTITWYAYFPSNEVDLTGQTGAKADVANLYALAGATASATTGEEGLNITMSPKVAILVINNQIGTININVKNSATTWVSGLTANADGFDVTTSTTQQNLLSVTTKGTYYVAVPAGVKLAVKDGDTAIKSTDGLTAGKYYNLTLIGYGKAYATTPNCDVNWVQLWAGGPKFAEYNVGATSATEYGGYYAWGGNEDKGSDYIDGEVALSGDTDTATKLWGDNWRMPTNAELEALLNSDNCTCKWTENYNGTDINGLLCTGKGDYKDNSVFLPATGYYFRGEVLDLSYLGSYWSSTPNNEKYEFAWFLGFGFNEYEEYYQSVEGRNRICGFSVRPVLK